MLIIKLLLLPFSMLYGFIMQVRNAMFNAGILSSKKFSDLHVISVGNLTTGGTGKTPHIEYLVKLIGDNPNLAILSRGYKRKTKGYKLATNTTDVSAIGDEPKQYQNKFNATKVAVDESRVHGIETLKKQFPDLSTVLLDDAYQHRYVTPSLNILLIDYSTIGESQYLVPSGSLREYRKNTDRADVIIVSKCPSIFSPIERRRIEDGISLKEGQQLFFSFMKYEKLTPYTEPAKKLFNNHFNLSDHRVIGITGIAKNSDFKDYINRYSKESFFMPFKDHHDYTMAEILEIEAKIKSYTSRDHIIVTTEKDMVKLMQPKFNPITKNLPIFVLPIAVDFHDNHKELFNKTILDHVRTD